jgi:metal-responsive CopG/Arc/MetJ family transcriptional regulator
MIIKATISEEEGEQFAEALRDSEHGSRSSYLRQIINEHLAKVNNRELVKGIEPKDVNDLKQENFPIRINKFLKDEADKRAETYGIKRAQWIRNLIQANLTKKPVLLEKSINEIRTANRELAAIGRNINQLTKVLNRSIELDFSDQVSHQHLIELKTEIEKNRAAINHLVKVSNGVWEIKE